MIRRPLSDTFAPANAGFAHANAWCKSGHHPSEVATITRQVCCLYGRIGRIGRWHPAGSQALLAGVIGLPAPMVSQLISGQLVMISNPAANARVVRLEELAGAPAVAGRDPVEIARVVADVTAADHGRGATQPPRRAGPDRAAPGSNRAADVLRMAAAAVPGTDLAALLGEAAAADWAGRRRT